MGCFCLPLSGTAHGAKGSHEAAPGRAPAGGQEAEERLDAQA